MGAIGAVLILVAVLLVNVLPEEDIIDPQYRADYEGFVVEDPTSFRSIDQDLPNGVLPLGEANAMMIPLEVKHNNAYEIVGQFFFLEDREETLPDIFTIELLDPDGNVVQRSNPQSTLETCDFQDLNPGEVYTPGVYYVTCESQSNRVAFNLGGKPASEIFTLESGANSTLADAEAAILQRDTRLTTGTWHFRIWLTEVGQCPSATPPVGSLPSQSNQRRATLCRLAVDQQNQDEGTLGGPDDPGNKFVLSRFEYTYYDILVSEG